MAFLGSTHPAEQQEFRTVLRNRARKKKTPPTHRERSCETAEYRQKTKPAFLILTSPRFFSFAIAGYTWTGFLPRRSLCLPKRVTKAARGRRNWDAIGDRLTLFNLAKPSVLERRCRLSQSKRSELGTAACATGTASRASVLARRSRLVVSFYTRACR